MPSKDLVVLRTLVLHLFKILFEPEFLSAKSFELPATAVLRAPLHRTATIHSGESIADKSFVETTK